MAQSTQSSESVSEAHTSRPVQFPPTRQIPFLIINLLFEYFSFIIMKLRQGSVILGTFLYARLFLPITIYSVALYGVIIRGLSDFWHLFMCGCHMVSVNISRIKASRLTSVLVISSLSLLVISSTFYSLGLEVIVDGKSIGYVYSQSDFNKSRDFVEQRASEILERPYTITPNIRFSLGIAPREKILSDNKLEKMFFSQVTEVSQLYVLKVDNEVIGASQNKETLQKMLDSLLGAQKESNVKSEFTRNVKITKDYADASHLRSYDEMMKILKSNIHEQITHTIVPGDTLDGIARNNGITKADLLALNPGLNANHLIAGKKLVTCRKLAFLPVKKVKRLELMQEIPYNVKKVETNTLYKGKTSVQVTGVKGQAKVLTNVEYLDNQVIKRNNLSYKVLRQPVEQVILVGTKTPPRTIATGTFRRPAAGYISSNYGYRRREFHTGVDFACPFGSRVVAADGGTVSFTGWKGGYGKLVIINHGNGKQTYYGHNSSIIVRQGERVAKGQQIARIGSTGNSTGPHCHFEIHINGRHVNPWRYID